MISKLHLAKIPKLKVYENELISAGFLGASRLELELDRANF